MARTPDAFDILELEYQVVRLRNALFFLLVPKGEPRRRKYFVIGHPRTATLALHQIFEANGIPAQHSSGNWRFWRYDAFSDRGNYQPFTLLARRYPEARFILNTRPAEAYLLSRMNHFAKSRRRLYPQGVRISVARARNELLRRNRYFFSVIHHFQDDDRLTVINIARPGALAFACQRLGLDFPGNRPSKPKARQVLTDADRAAIRAAFAELGLAGREDQPFIYPELLGADERQRLTRFLDSHAHAVYL